MNVCCRCRNCGDLMDVSYHRVAVRCPSCGATVLKDNDARITADYTYTRNGHTNVIGGDCLDEWLSRSDFDGTDPLRNILMDFRMGDETDYYISLAKKCA